MKHIGPLRGQFQDCSEYEEDKEQADTMATKKKRKEKMK
jgi:hypothetical protein